MKPATLACNRHIELIGKSRVAIKGPLTTPVGAGIRSLNVALRQRLDLYACIRPVKYFLRRCPHRFAIRKEST